MASPFGSPLDDLITQPGAGGDIARSAAENPPLPGETPDQTQDRIRTQAFRSAQMQAVKARDLAARGVPSFSDNGITAPVTDESGQALTNFDRRNGIAWDSVGSPRKLEYGAEGPPKLSDPFANIPVTLDKKTGNQYQIAPGLPWRYAGTDEAAKARAALDEEARNLRAQRSVLGEIAAPEKTAVAAITKRAKEQQRALIEMGHVIDPSATPEEARQQIAAAYDKQMQSPEANDTIWFSGGQLKPEAVALRNDIANRRAKALSLLDQVSQTGAQLREHSQRMQQVRSAQDDAATKLLRNQIARMKADGQDTSTLEKLISAPPQTAPPAPDAASSMTPEQVKQYNDWLKVRLVRKMEAPAPESAWDTFLRKLSTDIVPAAGTAAGSAIGVAAGSIPGALAGGAIGGAQGRNALRETMGDEWMRANEAQMKANETAHPWAATAGGAIPMLISFLGGGLKNPQGLGQHAADAALRGAKVGGSKGVQELSDIQADNGENSNLTTGGAVGRVVDEAARSAITLGATGFIPVAKTILGAVTGKAAGDVAAMELAGQLYDTVVHQKEIDPKAVADKMAGDYPAFAIQNALMHALFGRGAGSKREEPPDSSVKVKEQPKLVYPEGKKFSTQSDFDAFMEQAAKSGNTSEMARAVADHESTYADDQEAASENGNWQSSLSDKWLREAIRGTNERAKKFAQDYYLGKYSDHESATASTETRSRPSPNDTNAGNAKGSSASNVGIAEDNTDARPESDESGAPETRPASPRADQAAGASIEGRPGEASRVPADNAASVSPARSGVEESNSPAIPDSSPASLAENARPALATAATGAISGALQAPAHPPAPVTPAGNTPAEESDDRRKNANVPLQDIVPAIKVNGELIRGEKGDTHQDILNRLKDTDPEKWAEALPDFDSKANPNLFAGPNGEEISREQLKAMHGVTHSQDLKELQDKTDLPTQPKPRDVAVDNSASSSGEAVAPGDKKSKPDHSPAWDNLHPKTRERFDEAFKAKDAAKIAGYLHSANKGLRAEWEHRTGEKLPATVAGTKEAVEKHFSASREPREMDHEGRAKDGKPILPGDTFKTSSGRATTPYPKYSTKRTTNADKKAAGQWLIDNAIAEAKARGDDFNETIFSGEKADNLPPASVASMQEYLFGKQPDVAPPITKPVSPKAEPQAGTDAVKFKASSWRKHFEEAIADPAAFPRPWESRAEKEGGKTIFYAVDANGKHVGDFPAIPGQTAEQQRTEFQAIIDRANAPISPKSVSGTAASRKALVEQVNDAMRGHADELKALGHAQTAHEGQLPDGNKSGIATHNGKITVDSVKLEAATRDMTAKARNDYINAAVGEEVAHLGFVRFTNESPENRARALQLTKDEPAAVDYLREHYPGFDLLSDIQKAAEVARVIMQGKAGVTTESTWKFIKDLLAYLKRILTNMTEATRKVIADIEARMGRAKPAEKAEKPARETKPEAQRPQIAIKAESPKLTAAEQAVKDIMGDLFGAAAPENQKFDTPIPHDKIGALIPHMVALAKEATTPEAFAASVAKLGPKAPSFVQSLWQIAKSTGAQGPLEPDWKSIYAQLAPKPETGKSEHGANAAPKSAAELSQAVADALGRGESLDRRALAKLAESAGISVKEADEAAEAGIVMAAREIITKAKGERTARDLVSGDAIQASNAKIFDALRNLLERQPNLTAKTSESKINQAYSTPVPIAFLADVLANVNGGQRIYEPTAGNGALLIGVDDLRKVIANELDPKRAANLERLGLESVKIGDALASEPPRSLDRIVTNPPFGSVMDTNGETKRFPLAGTDQTTTQIDHAIALHALQGLADNGRAVLILGGKQGEGTTRADKYIGGQQGAFWNALYSQYGVVDHFTINGDLYSKQGAGWPIDVVLIQGRKPSEIRLPSAQGPRILNTWEELKNELARSDSERKKSLAPDAERDAESLRRILAGEPAADRAGSGREPSVRSGAELPAAPQEPKPKGMGELADANSGEVSARSGGRGEVSGSPSGIAGGQAAPARTGGGSDPESPRAGQELAEPEPKEELQVPYVPKSTANSLGTLVPTNLREPTQRALAALEAAVGPLNEYVARKLGYPAGTDVGKYLAAEQVDAVASAIYQIENGRALVVGDQTGVGKGRAAAAMIAYAHEAGRVPIFVTAEPKLYSAMLSDLADIGKPTLVPFFTNNDVKFADEMGRQWASGKGASKSLGAIRQGLPPGANMIFTNYAQLNQAAKGFKETPAQAASRKMAKRMRPFDERAEYVTRIAPEAVFVLDESHKAGGDSEQGWRMAHFLKHAAGTYYSSATFAKRADNMAVYYKTALGSIPGMSHGDLVEIMNTGGTPLQQIVSQQLAESGQYLRRERSYEGIPFVTKIDEANAERDLSLADEFTKGLRAITDASNTMSEKIEQINTVIRNQAKKLGAPTAPRLESMEFGDKLNNWVSQYILAVKSKTVADEAIKAIKEGVDVNGEKVRHKVVIAVQNTMQGPIEALQAKGYGIDFNSLMKRAVDDLRVIKSGSFGNVKEFHVRRESPERFKDMNERALYAALVRTEPGVDVNGNPTRVARLDEDVAAELIRRALNHLIVECEETVSGLNLGDMPISPLDYMRQRAEKAGIKTGEITGRTLGVGADGKIYKRKASELTKSAQLKTMEAFNNSDLDLVILNQSGSTGISLHASGKFKNQTPRMMIVAQPNLDINEFMQMLGRIHRSGQVKNPYFMLLQSALSAEMRISAILGKKMQKLNANTTSNADTDVNKGLDMPDVLNQYGDEVTHQYLTEDKAFLDMLKQDRLTDKNGNLLPLPVLQEDFDEPGKLTAFVTGKMAVLPDEEQKEFWRAMLSRYNSLIRYLNETGQNELAVDALDIKARTLESKVFTEGKPGAKNEFEKESRLELVSAQMGREPETAESALEMGRKAKEEHAGALGKFRDDARAEIASRIETAKTKSLAKWTDEKEQALKKRLLDAGNTIFAALKRIGEPVKIDDKKGMEGYGVITDFKPGSILTPSDWVFTITTNTTKHTLKIAASQFADIVEDTDPQEFAKNYTDTMERNQNRHIITGNLLAGYARLAQSAGEGGKVSGKIIHYTTDTGEKKTGILLPLKFSETESEELGDEIENAHMARVAIGQGVTVQSKGKQVRIEAGKQPGTYTLKVPASREGGGKFWRHPQLNALMNGGAFEQKGAWMSGTVSDQNLAGVLQFFADQEVPLYAKIDHNAPPSSGTFSAAKPTESDKRIDSAVSETEKKGTPDDTLGTQQEKRIRADADKGTGAAAGDDAGAKGGGSEIHGGSEADRRRQIQDSADGARREAAADLKTLPIRDAEGSERNDDSAGWYSPERDEIVVNSGPQEEYASAVAEEAGIEGARRWLRAFHDEEGAHGLLFRAARRLGIDPEKLVRRMWKHASVTPALREAMLLGYNAGKNVTDPEATFGHEMIRAAWQVLNGRDITEETAPWKAEKAAKMRAELEKWQMPGELKRIFDQMKLERQFSQMGFEGPGGLPPKEIAGKVFMSRLRPLNPGESGASVNPAEAFKAVKKAMTPGLDAIGEIKTNIQSLLLPGAASAEHLARATEVGKHLGAMHRREEQDAHALNGDWKHFVKLGVTDERIPLTQNPGIKAMSDISQGRPLTGAVKEFAERAKTMFDRNLALLEKFGAPVEKVRENYFPGVWTKPSIRAFSKAMQELADMNLIPDDFDINDAPQAMKETVAARVKELLNGGDMGSNENGVSYFSRRPLKGRETFRRQKVFEDIMIGVEFGLVPISNNPVDIVKTKLAEMNRSIMANGLLREWEKAGQVIAIGNDGQPMSAANRSGFNRAEWDKINDKYGTIWRRGENGELIKQGERWARRPAADILNNYLSSSLYNNRYFGKPYKAWMSVANALNQSQLGVGSAFHAGFTAAEAQVSAGANVLKDIYGVIRGNRSFGDLGRTLAEFPAAIYRTYKDGDAVLNAWRNPDGTMDQRIRDVAQAWELSGGGFKLEQGMKTDQASKAYQDWHSGHALRAAARSPIAAIELMAKPIMEWLVPRQKAGVFAHLAWRTIEQNPGKTMEELAPEFRSAAMRIDARLGQVRYDRLFINNTAKNIVQGLIRAPGWSGGTIAELGGSFKDLGGFFKEWSHTGKPPKDMPDRIAYTLSLLLSVGLANALLTYLFTGKKADGNDFFAFRTGRKDERGNPERYTLPTYMKDVWAYAHAPGETLIHKLHPLIGVFGELWKNRDYYGVQIADEDANAATRAMQRGAHFAKAFVPFWMRGAAKAHERGADALEMAAPLIGVMPAPSAMNQSPAMRAANEINRARASNAPLTEQQAERRIERSGAINKLRQGDSSALTSAIASGKLQPSDAGKIRKTASLSPLAAAVNGMPLEQALRVYGKASAAEKRELDPIIARKRSKQSSSRVPLFQGF